MKHHLFLGGLTLAALIGYMRLASADLGPMAKWMRSNLARPMGEADGPALAKGLRTVASKPVKGMDQWVSIATAGAEAADKGDMAGVKASCKSCHSLYQKSYKENHRLDPW